MAASHHVTYVFPENGSVLCDFAATSGARVRDSLRNRKAMLGSLEKGETYMSPSYLGDLS